MYNITIDDVKALKRAKALLRVREKAEEKLNELTTLNSPGFGDKQHTAYYNDVGIDRYLTKKEVLKKELKKSISMHEIAKQNAYNTALKFDGIKQDFCIYHYVFGMSVEETAKMIDRSARQTWRIRASIEGVLKDENTDEEAPIS